MRYSNFPPETFEYLKYYVYAYIDPRNAEVFYIGKGQHNRAYDHLKDTSEKEKVWRIAEIQRTGGTPRIDILVHGLTESEALRVEAVCIDLIGIGRLTNLVTGHDATWGGRRPADDLIDELRAREVDVVEPAVAIKINKSYRYGMSPQQLYDATRGIWPVNRQRAERAHLAFALYRGVIKEVYEIERWEPAGTTPYAWEQREPITDVQRARRSEFVGHVASSKLRDVYLSGKIERALSTQFPVRYLNC